MTQPTYGHSELAEDTLGETIFLSHFVHTLRYYRLVILMALAAAGVAYALVALVAFLAVPAERVTSQAFRLDFEGAASGRFPNGLRFNTADIVSPTILLPAYRRNELQRYVSFPNFSRSIFVLESNPAYDLLNAEYQARLADPRLSPVDRERLLKEYEQKRDAIAKNEYSINYVRFEGVREIPEPIVRKVLSETLSAWSDFAIKNQDVLAYPIAVISPSILNPAPTEKTEPMLAAQMLRTRTVRLLENIAELRKMPGGQWVRGSSDRMSLEEVRLQLEEIQRYRIEPLISNLQASGAASASSRRFLQDQLDFDQRKLAAARKRAESIQSTLAMYEQSVPETRPEQPAAPSLQRNQRPAGAGETVMPQISDSFLDRMVDLVKKSADAQYRQKIVDAYRDAMETVIPLEQAVAYDVALLDETRRAVSPPVDAAAISTDIESIRSDLQRLVVRMNEIYREISRNVYSTSQLVTITAPPSMRVAHAIDPSRLILWGVVVMLVALPAIVIACLLHNRVREEEARSDQFVAA